MNVQTAPSPYTSVGAGPMPMGNPPVLGQQVPGTTGGLPALGGLSVAQNPLAKQLQSYGRGDDSMLVHMTPNEVNSLQGLAMAHGGSLTINPHTGLPEAGWLGKLLPTILGIAGAAFGVPTWAIGLGVGAGQTAITGDLGKGLTAGLQAFGGAGLGQAAGVGGELGSLGTDLGLTQNATGASGALSKLTSGTGGAPAIGKAAEGTFEAAFDKTFGAKAPGFLSKFGAETGLGQTGLLGKALPIAAGSAVLGGISDATAPQMPKYTPEKETPYVPMGPSKREVMYQTPEQMRQSGGAEFTYFTPSNPAPVPLAQSNAPSSNMLSEEERNYYGYADGGLAALPASRSLDELTQYFGSTNPGAITASMYPTSAASQQAAPAAAPKAAEQVYNFSGRTPTQSGTDSTTYSGVTLPNLSNIDWTSIAKQYGYMPQVSQPEQAQPAAPSYDYYPQFDEQMYQPYDYISNVGEFAVGGDVNMGNGSFVVDARTVSELGNGSSNAGKELLARLGGRPLNGSGDGVSDSIPARIGGHQQARVARDEVIMPPEAVRRMGGGSEKKGTAKLYQLMDKAHKARKNAKRGQDTKLAKGLGALA